ncbi:m-AAA protease-interacting protein 1, mitochondrial [Aplochiton taeniatus]
MSKERVLTTLSLIGSFSPYTGRLYSTESENDGKSSNSLPTISVIGIPDPITWIRNKAHMYLIELYYDLGITTVDFDNGVKQAFVHVSNMMSTGNTDALRGLLSKEMVEYADKRCKALTESQRQHLAISLEDIVFLLPEDVTLLFHHGKKDVYIIIRFWYLSTTDGPDDPESTKMFKVASSDQDSGSQKIVTAVYEFHRELTKGAAPDWTVTSIWHWHLKQTE